LKKIFFLPTLFIACQSFAQLQRFYFSQPKMGSPFTLIFYAADSMQANTHATSCYRLVDSLNMILSDYDPQSEINRLSEKSGNHEWVSISPVLFEVLQQSAAAWQKSRGAIDITIGSLSKLWRQARSTKNFPEDEKVQKAKAQTGFKNILLDTLHHRLKLLKPEMQLDFGAIAKGYIAQKVIDHLRDNTIDKALIDAGGDIAVSGAPPGKKGWSVAVNIPESEELLPQRILLSDKSVATSGDLYQYIEKDGHKYSHIIDPSTGYGVLHRRNVTVIADDGATADWLATACSILPIRKAKKLVCREKASLLIAEWKKGKLVFHSFNGFEKYYEGK
jgi:thiamine biosynthesis lipoprotein